MHFRCFACSSHRRIAGIVREVNVSHFSWKHNIWCRCKCIDIKTNYNRIASSLNVLRIAKVIRVTSIHNKLLRIRLSIDSSARERRIEQRIHRLGRDEHCTFVCHFFSLWKMDRKCEMNIFMYEDVAYDGIENKITDHHAFTRTVCMGSAMHLKTYFFRVPT